MALTGTERAAAARLGGIGLAPTSCELLPAPFPHLSLVLFPTFRPEDFLLTSLLCLPTPTCSVPTSPLSAEPWLKLPSGLGKSELRSGDSVGVCVSYSGATSGDACEGEGGCSSAFSDCPCEIKPLFLCSPDSESSTIGETGLSGARDRGEISKSSCMNALFGVTGVSASRPVVR